MNNNAPYSSLVPQQYGDGLHLIPFIGSHNPAGFKRAPVNANKGITQGNIRVDKSGVNLGGLDSMTTTQFFAYAKRCKNLYFAVVESNDCYSIVSAFESSI